MIYSNFHNHTTFCDGKNTMEDMVKAAVALGCRSIGFSGHSYTSFDESYCMSREGTALYRKEVCRLKEAYGDKIRILCGIEQDYFADDAPEGFDFVIGSVHYVLKDGVKVPVDNSKEEFIADVSAHFGGDYLAFCEAYYEQVAQVASKTGCTFVGHFDLVTKFNEGGCLFDENDPRYRAAAFGALDELCGQGALFEINTGAMAKGYRSAPYPAVPLLRRMAERGCKVVLTSDCHAADKLQHGLAQADALAKRLGLSVVYEL